MKSRRTARLVVVLMTVPALLASFTPTVRADGTQVNFSFTVVSRTPETDRIILTGDGQFNSAQVVGNGTFVHFLAGGPPPRPIQGAGTWKARRLVGFTFNGTYGPGVSGILLMEVDLVPDGGGVIPATMRVVCNIGAGGLDTGSAEGVTLEIPGGGTFSPAAGLTFMNTGVEPRR